MGNSSSLSTGSTAAGIASGVGAGFLGLASVFFPFLAPALIPASIAVGAAGAATSGGLAAGATAKSASEQEDQNAKQQAEQKNKQDQASGVDGLKMAKQAYAQSTKGDYVAQSDAVSAASGANGSGATPQGSLQYAT